MFVLLCLLNEFAYSNGRKAQLKAHYSVRLRYLEINAIILQNSRIIIEIPILSLRGGKVYSKNKLNKIISVYPVFTDIILSCANHDEARSKLLSATKNLLEENENAEFLNISGLQFSVRLTCYRVFRQFLSLRSVKLTGFDGQKFLFIYIKDSTSAPDHQTDF